MRVVEERRLRELVSEEDALAAVERAFAALARGEVVQPAPMGFDFPDAKGEVHVKGAHLLGARIFAIKVASGFYENPKRSLPPSSGLVLVLDAETGFPLGLLLDNAYLTELRTAAAGALATRLLAPEGISRMAVLGTGAQARYQLRAISRVRRPSEVSAWSPRGESRERYCAEMRESLGLSVSPAASAEEAVSGASLVLTVTPARAPLFGAEHVSPGATVIAVGSDGPDKQELDVELLARADKLVADELSQCVRLGEIHHAVEAGILSQSEVYAELGEIVVGAKRGREGHEIIVCDLTGVGAQDAAIAETAWTRLSAEG